MAMRYNPGMNVSSLVVAADISFVLFGQRVSSQKLVGINDVRLDEVLRMVAG